MNRKCKWQEVLLYHKNERAFHLNGSVIGTVHIHGLRIKFAKSDPGHKAHSGFNAAFVNIECIGMQI